MSRNQRTKSLISIVRGAPLGTIVCDSTQVSSVSLCVLH